MPFGNPLAPGRYLAEVQRDAFLAPSAGTAHRREVPVSETDPWSFAAEYRCRAGMTLDQAAIWEQIGPEGDPLQRVTLAHYMADVQDYPGAELEWDLRALAAAESLTDERTKSYNSTLLVRRFYASLHLNLANDYQKLDRVQDTRRHLTLAERATPDLPPGGYGNLVRSGIAALRRRLAT